MAENAIPVDSIDNRYYRRAGITAVAYAVVDLLILLFGGLFVPFRLIGVIAAYFVIRDMMVLRDAGVEWGWTRYLVLVLVAIGGFLGFIIYAWRRYSHLQDHSWPETDAEDGSTDPGETGAEAASADDPDSDASEVVREDVDGDTADDSSDGPDAETAPESDRSDPG